jgi:hypothetical protein
MKILIGVDKGSYTFSAAGQSVTLSGIPKLDIKQVLLITNLTTNDIIYSPVIPGKGGTISNNVISLTYNTTSMNDSDNLQIFVHLNDALTVQYGSDSLSAFGSLPVYSQVSLFESSFSNGRNAGAWELITATGGTTSYFTQSSTLDLIVGPTVGSRVLNEQHGYNFYTPGQAQTILLTTVFGTSQSGVTKRAGYYNDLDGLYFEQSNGVLYTCLRSSSSGTLVNNRFTQSTWNRDTLDGSYSSLNPSGILLDPSKAQVLFIDFQWLGVGRIRYGYIIDGNRYIVHEVKNANNLSNTYMGSPSLPIRYEIFLTSGIAGTSTLKQICTNVNTNNDIISSAKKFTASTGVTSRTISSGVRNSLISIRLATIIDGRINRAIVIPSGIDILITSNSQVFVEIVLQKSNLNEPNLGGTPTWTTVNNSVVEYSRNGTTTTGGSVISSGFISSTTRNVELSLNGIDDFLAMNSSGTQSDYLHVVVTPIGANTTLYGSINYFENR